MYDYKKFHVWLMVISFWVLHTFGTHAIFKNYNFFSLDNQNRYVYLHTHGQYEDVLEDIFFENKNTNFFKKMMKRMNLKKRVTTQEIILCDNRIDKIDKQYPEYLCASNLPVQENKLISVV